MIDTDYTDFTEGHRDNQRQFWCIGKGDELVGVDGTRMSADDTQMDAEEL